MIQRISTDKLRWNKENKTFTAEVSTALDGFLLTARQVEVISHKTGALRVFEMTEERRDRDWDIVSWKFECRANPTIKLVLFND